MAMTKTERKMMFILAKGMSRLSGAMAILAKQANTEEVVLELKRLEDANQKELNEFIDLVAEEWLKDE